MSSIFVLHETASFWENGDPIRGAKVLLVEILRCLSLNSLKLNFVENFFFITEMIL